MKRSAQIEIAGPAEHADKVLTLESDHTDKRMVLLRWPGAPPIFVWRAELIRAAEAVKE